MKPLVESIRENDVLDFIGADVRVGSVGALAAQDIG
jgi:hypothetical protein